MKRKLKWVAVGFSLTLVVLAAAPFFLPQKTYKNWLIQKVETSLPVRLRVRDFYLRFLPFPSLKMGGVQVFSAQTPHPSTLLVEAETIKASVELVPLLARKLVVSLAFEKPLLNFSLKGAFHFNANRDKLFAKNLKLKFNQYRAVGNVECNLKNFLTQGHVRVQDFDYEGYPFKNTEFDFTFKPPRQLEVPTFKSFVWDTKAKGEAAVQLSAPIAYTLNINLDNADLTRLGFLKGQVVGRGQLSTSLSGKIIEGRKPAKDLNATGMIQVNEGSIPSLKLGEEIFGHTVWDILTPLTGFNKKALASLKTLDAKVEKLLIPFEIKQGVARILDVKWQHPRYAIALKGSIGLDQSLGGEGAFVLPEAEVNQLIQEPAVRGALTNAQGQLLLPFMIGGSLTNPKITPDKKTLVPRFTKAVAVRGVESLKEGIEGIFQPKSDGKAATPLPAKILEGIFGK